VPVFSLARLLTPLLKNKEWPAKSVALVTVEVRSPDGLLSMETRDEWSRDTRSLLQQCLLPDLDVLLPKMGVAGPEQLFQVVAFADEKGVAVLTKRIREQFQRMKHFKESDLEFSTSYSSLNKEATTVEAQIEDLTAEMAARTEQLIKSETSARMVQ
jgi:hypothetical protein